MSQIRLKEISEFIILLKSMHGENQKLAENFLVEVEDNDGHKIYKYIHLLCT